MGKERERERETKEPFIYLLAWFKQKGRETFYLSLSLIGVLQHQLDPTSVFSSHLARRRSLSPRS